jgi:hypothetical protein
VPAPVLPANIKTKDLDDYVSPSKDDFSQLDNKGNMGDSSYASERLKRKQERRRSTKASIDELHEKMEMNVHQNAGTSDILANHYLVTRKENKTAKKIRYTHYSVLERL